LLRLFVLSFIAGIVLTLLGAQYYPLPEAPRLPSGAAALANGGREDLFFVRLPGDRLGSPRAAAVADFPETAFSGKGSERILAELFRIRDGEGRVVGMATKMTGDVAKGRSLARRNIEWMISVPNRGALFVSTQGQSVDTNRGYPLGRMGLDLENSGAIIYGTDEFAGLTGFMAEETAVDGVDENGQVQGEVTLRIRTMTVTE
jgi:hypothetical protein